MTWEGWEEPALVLIGSCNSRFECWRQIHFRWAGPVGEAGCKLSLPGYFEGLRAKHGPLTWDQGGRGLRVAEENHWPPTSARVAMRRCLTCQWRVSQFSEQLSGWLSSRQSTIPLLQAPKLWAPSWGCYRRQTPWGQEPCLPTQHHLLTQHQCTQHVTNNYLLSDTSECKIELRSLV